MDKEPGSWKRREKIEGEYQEKHVQMFSKGICVFECAYMYIHVLVHMGVKEQRRKNQTR